MADHAISSDPGVQAQLDRLWSLSPGADVLGVERITQLLARLDNPERRLPPMFHVAGTNGKGSTCAFLRAALEAAGHRVHVYSSPHLVRFNERIRLAGRLIDDETLAVLLAEVLDVSEGIGASFFEVTTAAAFLAFARTPADACIIEVGLGGRLDATNVVAPVVTGIAALGIDHEAFLGNTLIGIAAEKAGIAKPGVPLVTMAYAPEIAARIADVAQATSAPVIAMGQAWSIERQGVDLVYREPDGYRLDLERPTMTGAFQAENYALAITMLRHQRAIAVPESAIREASRTAHWPARMQRLNPGPLVDRLPGEQRHFGVWVDGAHNVSAAQAIGDTWGNGVATAVVMGMLANKDAEGVIAALTDTSGGCTFVGVPVPGHAHHAPEVLAAIARNNGADACAADSLEAAFDLLAARGGGSSVLVAGSLYLAGEALAANDEPPS